MKKQLHTNRSVPSLISIIVPVFNAEAFLEKCIESVINQSYGNIELILVNDGSTDNSEVICERFRAADRRVKVISQKNRGTAAARNTGVHHASGEFVFFLDADDYIERTALEKLTSSYEQYGPDLVMGNFCKLENNGEIFDQGVSFSPENIPFVGQVKVLTTSDIQQYVRHFFKYPSNHLISYCWARLYKMSVIKEQTLFANEEMRLFEDFAFNLDYLKHTDKVVFVNEPLYIYTMHNSHISASMAIVNAKNMLHDMSVFREKARAFFHEKSSQSGPDFDIEQEIGHTLIHYIIIFLIRSCRLANSRNRKMISNEIRQIIESPIYRESLPKYTPLKGNNRVLPVLTKLKLPRLTMIYCRYKAYKRYGRLSADATR